MIDWPRYRLIERIKELEADVEEVKALRLDKSILIQKLADTLAKRDREDE